jgi:glycylpeptide N-tetradecanoyltransferase
MSESKEVEKPEGAKGPLDETVEEALEGEEGVESSQASQSSKSKKKKKRSKLRNLLSHKPNAEVSLAEVEDAIASSTVEEKKSLTKDEQHKLDMIIKKMNQLLPGGHKEMADHKFWKTQPVLKFGSSLVTGAYSDEIVSEEGPIEPPQPDSVRKEPLPVAGDLEFVTMDLTNDSEVDAS